MRRGPLPLVIRRKRDEIAADCMDCDWKLFGCNRNRAMHHARAERHRVHFEVEETTVYDGREAKP